ncbi:carbon-nitrogen hydrolase [Candidatus Woesearchaeota archaeon]|nr:carbon-nitrogen hydrolase [Candidatus Woesearchaeota archaeon]
MAKQYKSVKIALIQSAVSEDINKNLLTTVQKIKQAAKNGAQIVCLQELFRIIYIGESEKKEYFSLAEADNGETVATMQKLAKENKIVIITPFFEVAIKKNPKVRIAQQGEFCEAKFSEYFNTTVVVDADGTIAGKYRKMHIPHDPGFWERYYFKNGDLGFQAIQTKYAKIGVLICWDQWFPEAARLMTLSGAEILFYPTAIGWYKEKEPKLYEEYKQGWMIMQRSHAIANSVYVAAVNRVGKEFADKVTFWGNSFVCGNFGQFLAYAGESEEILYADCDLSENKEVRDSWGFFNGRRTDAYKGLLEKEIKEIKK